MAVGTNKMFVFSNPADGHDAEFSEWYENVHIPEVLATPGMVAAQRFEASAVSAAGPPATAQKYVTVYEMDGDPETVFAAMVERAKSGAISQGQFGDAATTAMAFYTPRTERVTQ